MPKTPRKARTAAPATDVVVGIDPGAQAGDQTAVTVRDVTCTPPIDLLAATVEMWDLDELWPYDRNTRQHSEAQKAALESAMRKYGWTVPLLVRPDGGIIAGHARWEVAADRLKLKQGPCIVARGWTEEMIRAYVIWDNRSAEMATWDLPMLRLEVGALEESGFDLSLVGFDLPSIDALALSLDPANDDAGDGETYSRKMEAPIYTPKGEAPAVSELFDDTKAEALKARITAAELPEDVAHFLTKAAERHTVFDFAQIADFYAHAPAETQRLMEESALIIIDFNRAIESGFVRLNDRLAALASEGAANG